LFVVRALSVERLSKRLGTNASEELDEAIEGLNELVGD
jgi:hypothetical protein